MTSFICVFIASLLPILWIAISKIKAGFQIKNNHNPREFLSQSSGVALRAKWAQENAWESFAPFAAAVIIAHLCQVDQNHLSLLAIVFIVARLLHGVFYLTDKAGARSIVWLIGIGCNITLYILSFINMN